MKFSKVIKYEFKNIYKDPMLFVILFIPIIIGLLIQFGLPKLTPKIIKYVNLKNYYNFIVGYATVMIPMLYGFIIGFVMLDEKDESLIKLYSISPIGKTGYLVLKLMTSVVITFLSTCLFLKFASFKEISNLKIIGIASITSLETPIMALMLISIAKNKVEGLAISKLLNIIYLAPFAIILISGKLQYIFGIFSSFWITKIYLTNTVKLAAVEYIISLLIHIVYIAVLVEIFKRKTKY